MIVVDASVVVDYLLAAQIENQLTALIGSSELLLAPQNIDLEVLNALRRGNYGGVQAKKAAANAFVNFGELRIVRYPSTPFLARIWQLRENVTAYDAAYISLAEAVAMPFYTRDRKLARATGHSAHIILI